GQISQPRIVWKQFVGLLETELILEGDKGSGHCNLPIDEGAASAEFTRARPSFKGSSMDPMPAASDSTTTVFADVLPDEPGLEKIEFESGFAKPTVRGQWQPCVGRCFAHRSGQWVPIWQTEPIDLLFQPLPLVGDFDGDGLPDIAILPFHQL